MGITREEKELRLALRASRCSLPQASAAAPLVPSGATILQQLADAVADSLAEAERRSSWED